MNSKVFPFLVMLAVFGPAVAGAAASAQYAGRVVCASCHAEQASLWSGSHHDLAMQPATGKTVLGSFANTSLMNFGVTSTFFKEDDKFMVRTEGPDGKLQDYVIKYVFGVEPLQQYLIEFPGGRLQALSLAWDSRAKEQGGQRWFHLYPDEKIAHDDELHWTKPSQNWNSMCAECHSTHLEKNYDPVNRTFDTRWSKIDVSCEACHGPGSEHVIWAEQKPGWEKLAANKGLSISLDERKDVQWKMDPKTGNAARNKARTTDKEIEMCARCHARRSPISGQYAHGE
ncbi:MAG: multiheme c-type cytochrome, partial [Gammaproteobacteria bacterium]|nr:multiheme c-type cytochrome [Gammaproteobacteria bacterium]